MCHNHHWDSNGINILRCNCYIASFPGHMGMSPSVTGSELLSLTHWLSKQLFISVEYTQQAHYSCLATTSFPTNSLSKQAVHYIAHLLSGSHVCLIVSLSWMSRWFPMKQKCNHRRKTLHIWSFYQGMFGKPNHSFQLIPGQERVLKMSMLV